MFLSVAHANNTRLPYGVQFMPDAHNSYSPVIPCYRSAQMLEMYKEFCTKYPVISIEDPFEQDDWEPAKSLTAENICQVRGE